MGVCTSVLQNIFVIACSVRSLDININISSAASLNDEPVDFWQCLEPHELQILIDISPGEIECALYTKVHVLASNDTVVVDKQG